MEPVEHHVREVERGRRWWTPFAVQTWVFLAVAVVAAIVILVASLAYVLA